MLIFIVKWINNAYLKFLTFAILFIASHLIHWPMFMPLFELIYLFSVLWYQKKCISFSQSEWRMLFKVCDNFKGLTRFNLVLCLKSLENFLDAFSGWVINSIIDGETTYFFKPSQTVGQLLAGRRPTGFLGSSSSQLPSF